MWFGTTTPVAVAVTLLLSLSESGGETERESFQRLHPSSSPRRGRFLGLLGFLTGLSLFDSLEDSEPHVRVPTGIVKINIGRPVMEQIYQYAYNPYQYGAVPSINIKIPIRPESEFEGVGFGGLGAAASAGVGFGSFGGPVGHFGNAHVGTSLIEPRPVLADAAEPVSEEQTEEKAKQPKYVKKFKRSKLPSTRIVRSTLKYDITEDDQIPEATEDQNQLDEAESTTTSQSPVAALDLSDPPALPGPFTTTSTTEEPLILHGTAIPVIEDNSIVAQQSQYLQADVPQSYYAHAGSLRDPSAISLTTTMTEPDLFKPSRRDRLQDYYSSPDEFRPIV